jgi:hypothetical protein
MAVLKRRMRAAKSSRAPQSQLLQMLCPPGSAPQSQLLQML